MTRHPGALHGGPYLPMSFSVGLYRLRSAGLRPCIRKASTPIVPEAVLVQTKATDVVALVGTVVVDAAVAVVDAVVVDAADIVVALDGIVVVVVVGVED